MLRLAYEGLAVAQVGGFVNGLVLVMFAVCTALAFRKTWEGFTRRPADPAREETLRGLKAIGFVGSLLAYFCRSLKEAPGERCCARSTRRPASSTRAPRHPHGQPGDPQTPPLTLAPATCAAGHLTGPPAACVAGPGSVRLLRCAAGP